MGCRVLIIGYGNPLRRDDGFGWRAAERLREAIPDPEVEILSVQQLTPELMESIANAGRVVFIDASATAEPGELLIRTLEPGAAELGSFAHFSKPETLLAGAEALYGARPSAILVTAGGADFGLGEGLSDPVQAAVEILHTRLGEIIPR